MRLHVSSAAGLPVNFAREWTARIAMDVHAQAVTPAEECEIEVDRLAFLR